MFSILAHYVFGPNAYTLMATLAVHSPTSQSKSLSGTSDNKSFGRTVHSVIAKLDSSEYLSEPFSDL